MEIQIQSLINSLKAQRNEAMDVAAEHRALAMDLEARNSELEAQVVDLRERLGPPPDPASEEMRG